MRETCELRVDEDFAGLLFAKHEGKRIGTSVRKVELETNDPKFAEAGRLQTELRHTKGKPFFYGWHIRRYYSEAEYRTAGLFHLTTNSAFEPAGEECGTKYDESAACKYVFAPELETEVSGHTTTIPASSCGVGARQVSDLFLDWKRIPKRRDIARTIAGEIIVSKRLVELFRQHDMRGADFQSIRHNPASSAESKDWFQLIVQSGEVEITRPTKAGIGPFDEDTRGRFRCPLGHVIGLNLLSEVWLSRISYDGSDIVASKQFVGCRLGLLRPERLLFVSPKLRHLLTGENIKGFGVDVAHISEQGPELRQPTRP